MNRREFLASGAASLAALAGSARRALGQETPPAPPSAPPPPASEPSTKPRERPNFLLIVSDDQSFDDLGCQGNATIGTPNLDRLASESLRFTRAFTPTAICQPSRGALHTGLHGTTSGIDGFTFMKPGIPTLPGELKKAGYRTALLGKTHLEPIDAFPFDLLKPSEELSSGRDVDAFARWARSFVKECAAASQSFFLNVNFDDPHWPWPLTAEEAQEELPRWMRRANGIDPRHRALGKVAGTHDPATVRLPGLLPDRPEIRGELARYADGITRLDRGVGLLLELLEQTKLAERTIVLFLSDNGMEFPFHKTTLWEGGVHLPLFVRAPGLTKPGSTCDGLVSFVDVMPTLLDLAGVPADAQPKLEGRSFAPALLDPRTRLRDDVLLTHSRHRQDVAMPSRGLRTTRYKYLRNFWPDGVDFMTVGMRHASWDACLEAAKSDAVLAERCERYLHRPPTELYDLDADPLEKTNLAGVAALHDLEHALQKKLRATMDAIADPLAGRV